MRIFTILLVLMFLPITSFAKDRTESEMMAIARQTLGMTQSQTRTSGENLTKLASRSQLNVYGAKGYGFVIVSRNDGCIPILGYSDTDFDTTNMPCGFSWWLKSANQSLEERIANHENYQPIFATASTAVNFIKSAWNQQAPYNTLCPEIDGTKAPVGCIATAMAQIMYYYKYPACGKGIGTYTVTTKNGSTAGKLDIKSTYEWTKMKDKYLRPVDTDNAVATLMRDAGAASNMKYAQDGSGTTDFHAAIGFCDNFRYDSLALVRYERDFFTDQEWMQMITTEMQAKRPILYCGSDPTDGGHAFIFDGINDEGLVHVNWGWSGSGNGWYDINVLKPSSYGGSGLSDGDGFNEYQSMVFGFKTQEIPDNDETNTSLWVTDGYSFEIKDNKLYANLLDAYNYNFRYFDGVVDLVMVNTKDENDIRAINLVDTKESGDGIVKWGYGYMFSNDNAPESYDLTEDFPNIPAGSYKLYMGSKSVTENSYQYVRGVGGPIIYRLNVADDGALTIEAGNHESTGVSDIVASPIEYTSRLYDLNGIQVSRLFHGIVIMNGKKVVKEK